jgi:multiple sugar transport system permease protein
VLAYALGPVAAGRLSVQDEAEIARCRRIDPQRPTLQNRAIFNPEKTVTYETSSHKDPAAGGYILSTAKNQTCCRVWRTVFEVAFAVVVLNLWSACRRPMRRQNTLTRSVAVYSILATSSHPRHCAGRRSFCLKNLGLVDNILSLIAPIWRSRCRSRCSSWCRFPVVDGRIRGRVHQGAALAKPALRHVFLPLAVPSLVAVVLFSFLASWNEFLLALMFTQTTASQTLPIVVASFASDFTISFSFINAAGVIAIVPPILLALLFERYIVSGLTAGAVKG